MGNGNVLEKPITELIFTSFPFFSICMSISELSLGNIIQYSFFIASLVKNFVSLPSPSLRC